MVMVLLLASKENKAQSEIFEILELYKSKSGQNDKFTVFSAKDFLKSDKKRGVVIITDNNISLSHSKLPRSLTGICDFENIAAIKIFESNKNPVITCGMGSKNTVTINSISDRHILLGFQRGFYGINGTFIEPSECKITLPRNYLPFSVMAAFTVLKIYGIDFCD